MSSSYRYHPPTNTHTGGGLLPIGDYQFVVTNIDPPHVNPKSGNLVCAVELAIQPDGQKVFANPWAHAEGVVDKNGVHRDQIAEFLVAIGCAPNPGEEPSWTRCVGRKGKLKLKIEDDLNGVPRNKVAFFFTPKQASPGAAPAARTAFDKARTTQPAAAAPANDNDVEPDDIPF